MSKIGKLGPFLQYPLKVLSISISLDKIPVYYFPNKKQEPFPNLIDLKAVRLFLSIKLKVDLIFRAR